MLLADESLPPPLAALRGLMRSRQPAAERCELCGLALSAEHEHLVEPATRRLVCSCTACAILFDGRDSGRFRRVRRQLEQIDDFQITDAAWQSLSIPIDLAFLYVSAAVGGAAGGAVAIYPSAAGPIQSQLPPDAWQELLAANPRLAELTAEVEAILVNRLGKRREYYRLSIDRCYELIGLIRIHWRGFSGGTEAWKRIDEFFAKLRAATEPAESTC